jgi:branched-chain amino acid transport system permease protein
VTAATLQRGLGYSARAIALAGVLFALVWVLFAARKTNFGPAIDDPTSFSITLLNGITFAGLLFIVASGFSLIFGLMRVVNMAHGSFFLVGGYIAYEIQQDMTGTGQGFLIPTFDVNTWEWIAPALIAAACIAFGGLLLQQLFLRWNQGQDLRQALITIAVALIAADQVIAHFEGGNPVSVTWPGWTDKLVDLHVFDVHYSLQRLLMLALGVAVGALLWLWLYRTRTGMVIRAGVDDREMTSALGVNIQRTFALAFVVGAALAAFGGTVGASQGAVASGQDGQWLLNSLVVVIIGGMGSLLGAVAGSLLYGLVFSFSAVYLPTTSDNCCTQYSIVVTFVLLALVLAFRPLGLFGKAA